MKKKQPRASTPSRRHGRLEVEDPQQALPPASTVGQEKLCLDLQREEASSPNLIQRSGESACRHPLRPEEQSHHDKKP
jgi:hypothetical protein